MPLTFIEIEKQKSWRIGILFIVLLVMYVLIAVALAQGLLILFPFSIVTGSFWVFSYPSLLIIVLALTSFIALFHFYFAAFYGVSSVKESIGAVPPDPDDSVHRRLINIIEELHVVTGNRRKITCLVIPTLSMNALAAADLRGEAIIAITEGLLSRLSREQLEAVIAHEAYHILSGDCLETTVATSLFGIYASFIERAETTDEPEVFRVYPALILFFVLMKLSSLLSMFISREREYRADAGAVRMTRNPLAMAEALHVLLANWNGSGLISTGIEMLCIINPERSDIDESEGWAADLLSTHPPIKKRIAILLTMVRTGVKDFENKQDEREPRVSKDEDPDMYLALDRRYQWLGPYNIRELGNLAWLSPFTWITSVTGQTMEKASDNALLEPYFEKRLRETDTEPSGFACPSCRQPLFEARYEGTRVYQCNFCGGILVENNKIQRVLARQEVKCTGRIKALAKAVTRDNLRNSMVQKKLGPHKTKMRALNCSKCGNPMFRTFYSLAYLIEIDRCNVCGITWFDIDELEMLQCIIENKITARIEYPSQEEAPF